MRLAILLCLAAVCGSALATRADLFDASGDAGRSLLQQTGTQCSGAITHCNACRYQFFRGTVTRAICTACDTGYVPKALGTVCWCAAGYTWDGSACQDCGTSNWCPGSKSTATADPIPCGTAMSTISPNAKSFRECLVSAGYGWSTGGGTPCPAGFYNPGNNNRRCSRCPGGLETENTNGETPDDCVAPPGYYYLRGKAVVCAQGSYKAGYINRDCDECGDGTTTKPNEVGKKAATDCDHVLPGYFADTGFAAGTNNGTRCPINEFRAGTVKFDDVTAGGCQGCPTGLQTLPNVDGAADENDCQAPPGVGYDPTSNTATKCPDGEFKAGWNRQPCASCGVGFTTTVGATAGATSEDECTIPAGFNATSADGGATWVAAACPANTYGRSDATYGRILVECTKCIDNTETAVGVTAATNSSACGTKAGYGYYNGEASKCDYGSYNPGGNQDPCTSCGTGYNTTTEGSIASTDCQIAQGYTTDGSTPGRPKSCPQGTYKDTLGTAACTPCATGTTTSLPYGATASTDCDSCKPGFYAATSPASGGTCTLCPSGKYSTTGVVGGTCTNCVPPVAYGELMVSRLGTSAAEDCMQQFSTKSTSTTNAMQWDTFTFQAGALASQTAASLAICQNLCRDDNTCVFYEYDWKNSASCSLLNADAAITDLTKPTFDPATAGSDNWLLLEVRTGQYATYKMTNQAHASIGDKIADNLSFDDAKVACDGSTSCAGFNSDGAGNWRTFSGKKWLNFIGKTKVYGLSVNPWIANPSR